MSGVLKQFFSVRFLKFCTVGFSGVFVNLAVLWMLADLFAMQVNLASAIAIEVSINSNFAVNELWTFSDLRSGELRVWQRWWKFHIVSIVGAVIQWSIFVAMNMFWVVLLNGEEGLDKYQPGTGGFLSRFIIDSIADPPNVGDWKYLSQLIGLGASTFWNYFVNLNWTWKSKSGAEA